MFKDEQLADSLQSASYVIQNDKRVDTFVSRMGFKEENSLTDALKDQILSYLEENVSRNDAYYLSREGSNR